jgi:murein DD-endopeptidase MepM/ murein hydrolase activator NlpD
VVLATLLVASPASAATLILDGHATQGGVLFGTVEPGAKVALDGHPVEVAADGHFVLGFGRDAKPSAQLAVQHPDGSAETRSVAITQRQYDIQRIDGLPPDMVSPPPSIFARVENEQALVNKARLTDIHEPLFESGFVWPVQGIITGVYGSQRILNGEPRAPHMGVDIAGAVGTPIVAPADGVVTLIEPDFYLTGGTLIIDHGLGLSSVFIHLSKIETTLGARVTKGETVARMGQSGRATGPNLHWGLNWYRTRLDPALLVPAMPGGMPAKIPAGSSD